VSAVIVTKFQERFTRSECVYNCRVQRETCNSGNASHGDTFDVSVLTTTKKTTNLFHVNDKKQVAD